MLLRNEGSRGNEVQGWVPEAGSAVDPSRQQLVSVKLCTVRSNAYSYREMQNRALALFTIAGMHPAMTGRKLIAAEAIDNRRSGVLAC